MADKSYLTPSKKSQTKLNVRDSPNATLYLKMEDILRQMQHDKTGVPIKTVKSFLTKIPDVFSGEDVVNWLMINLDIDNMDEAINLGSLIAAYGYFFPIDDHVIILKCDGTFYRFQSPYYWSSNGWEPENNDYAVYLCKRTMQNKARLELADYEAENLARLQRQFSKNWEQIFTKAEQDAKLDRKRDKMQRKVLDSQERAFWDVHRPVPGCVNTTELDIKKSCWYKDRSKRSLYNSSPRKSNNENLDPRTKRENAESVKQQIVKLRQQLDRHCLKMSKVCESLIGYIDQHTDYDPQIVDVDPSNPWTSDDSSYWDMEYRKDISVHRAKRWKFSFGELLKDEQGKEEFKKFLEKEFSGENLYFWIACQQLKLSPSKDITKNAEKIYNGFLSSDSPNAINIDSKCQEITLKNMKNPDRFCFEAAQEHIYQLMKNDSYSRFLKSDQYKSLLTPKKSNEKNNWTGWNKRPYNQLTNESE